MVSLHAHIVRTVWTMKDAVIEVADILAMTYYLRSMSKQEDVSRIAKELVA
jgi:hypothetical protein